MQSATVSAHHRVLRRRTLQCCYTSASSDLGDTINEAPYHAQRALLLKQNVLQIKQKHF